MYAPGHFTRNQYGSYGAYKGYQDQQQQQRNRMTVGGSTGGMSSQQESPVGGYTEQLMGMLAGNGGTSNALSNALAGGGNSGGAGGTSGGAGGTAQVTGIVSGTAPYTQQMTQMAANQRAADAGISQRQLREQGAQQGIRSNSPVTKQMQQPQIAQSMMNRAAAYPSQQFQDQYANAQFMLPVYQGQAQENLALANNAAAGADLSRGYDLSQMGTITRLLIGMV